MTQWEAEHGFDDSLDEDGTLVNFGRPAEDPSTMRMNNQFPRWVPRLEGDELAAMESPGETVVNAIRNEMAFRLEDLNLKEFGRVGGSLDGTPYAHLSESEGTSE